MKKITDTDYFLPNIFAQEKIESLVGGATLPLSISGTCINSGEEGHFVLKFRAGEGMSYNSMIKELMGGFIAMELGLNVVEPVIINISSEFTEILNIPKEKTIAQNSLGLNYGSKLITGLKPIFKDMDINQELRIEGFKVLIFDIIINNIDRNYRKPNMLTDGNKIYILDHEKAFSFMEVLSFLRTQTPWLISDNELKWISNHFFWKEFKGKILKVDAFFESLTNLNNDFWNKAESLIPNEWSLQSNYFTGIKDHFIKIIENKDVLKTEIERILV